MTVYFISRHPRRAREWAVEGAVVVDTVVARLDPVSVMSGDVVIGSLPVNLARVLRERRAAGI